MLKLKKNLKFDLDPLDTLNDIYEITYSFFDFFIFRPLSQFWAKSGGRGIRKSSCNSLDIILQKRARRGQLRRVIPPQPFRFMTKVSPFWKLDIQGFNIMSKPKKSKIQP